ncbi:hypothetical protein STCU_10772 [Strigomonas culicis]|uniref:Uncharacterized protein n=1 Tax=Strigomonas culicis TaxID=28005 RepID=S9TGM0_9TRYP|nr:hypothetical protein STCU_10772 [Strigomonas culicis]|eukprot:EPY17182.1 hypothetical protein STCU_10772 [Strigomonas culicis]
MYSAYCLSLDGSDDWAYGAPGLSASRRAAPQASVGSVALGSTSLFSYEDLWDLGDGGGAADEAPLPAVARTSPPSATPLARQASVRSSSALSLRDVHVGDEPTEVATVTQRRLARPVLAVPYTAERARPPSGAASRSVESSRFRCTMSQWMVSETTQDRAAVVPQSVPADAEAYSMSRVEQVDVSHSRYASSSTYACDTAVANSNVYSVMHADPLKEADVSLPTMPHLMAETPTDSACTARDDEADYAWKAVPEKNNQDAS